MITRVHLRDYGQEREITISLARCKITFHAILLYIGIIRDRVTRLIRIIVMLEKLLDNTRGRKREISVMCKYCHQYCVKLLKLNAIYTGPILEYHQCWDQGPFDFLSYL